MTMEINKAHMPVQNTDHVIKCDLGVWYSDDKITGFKVFERTEKSTSIRIEFGKNKSVKRETISKEFAEGSKSLDDEIVNEKEDKIISTNDFSRDDVIGKHANPQYDEEKMEIKEAYTNKSSNGNISTDLSREKDVFQSETSLHVIKENIKDETSFGKEIEVNEEVSVNPAEQKPLLESTNDKEKIEDTIIANFVSNHAAFFIALSIVNFTLAVLITLFCFVFPGAYGHIKSALGKARDWFSSKIEAGITYGQELPNIGQNMAQKTTTYLFLPFKWMWRFLGCMGSCFGLKMPSINLRVASVYMNMPRLRASMPKWFSCLLNCFKSED